jgi:predicted DCC family thiol-disulfide oxidoreductase YuxK
MRVGEANIIFFDGVCGLCNKTVDFVLRADRNRVFLYSPLQGQTFRRITQNYPETQTVDSIYVLNRGSGAEKLLQRSDAILFILAHLPGYRWLARVGRFVPRLIRDTMYRLVAAIRYRIWGKRDSCRLPSSEERTRFLP